MSAGSNTDRLTFFLIMGGVILIGVVLFVVGINLSDGWPRSLLTQLGLALITAGVVAMSTGWYLKERLFEEIASRVSDMLAEFRAEAIDAFHLQKLPHELLVMIRKRVIEITVIERDRKAHYEMKLVSFNGGQVLRAEITSSSIYENLTTSSQPVEIYEEGAVFDTTPTDEETGFVGITATNLDGNVEPAFDLRKADLGPPWVTDQDGQPIFRRTLQFPPKCRVKVTTSEIGYFSTHDWDKYSVAKPTMNMELSLAVSGGKFKLDVRPDEALLDSFDRARGRRNSQRGH